MHACAGVRRRVNDPLPIGGRVQADYSVPSGRALYRADQVSDEVFELFLGSFAPERAAELGAPRSHRAR